METSQSNGSLSQTRVSVKRETSGPPFKKLSDRYLASRLTGLLQGVLKGTLKACLKHAKRHVEKSG
eukprot:354074-Chlamydomonas_euryale.AAC.2